MFETGFDIAFLGIAILAGLDYALRHSWAGPSMERSATKSTAMIALLIWAAAQGAPQFVLLGLAFSVFADYAISRPGSYWLTRSAMGFLLTQMCYMIAYSPMPLRFDAAVGPVIIIGLTTTVGAYFMYAISILQARTAGMVYVMVLLVQFILTQLIGQNEVLLAYAGVLFLISGQFLAAELALLGEDSPERMWTSPAVYGTYFAAQICIVLAFVTPVV